MHFITEYRLAKFGELELYCYIHDIMEVRKNKDYKKADTIRHYLKEAGFSENELSSIQNELFK